MKNRSGQALPAEQCLCPALQCDSPLVRRQFSLAFCCAGRWELYLVRDSVRLKRQQLYIYFDDGKFSGCDLYSGKYGVHIWWCCRSCILLEIRYMCMYYVCSAGTIGVAYSWNGWVYVCSAGAIGVAYSWNGWVYVCSAGAIGVARCKARFLTKSS